MPYKVTCAKYKTNIRFTLSNGRNINNRYQFDKSDKSIYRKCKSCNTYKIIDEYKLISYIIDEQNINFEHENLVCNSCNSENLGKSLLKKDDFIN